MIDNALSSPRATTLGGSLVRVDLLHAALHALGEAKTLDVEASRRPPGHATASLRERLDAYREILARRAANVALGTVCTAEELAELREATRNLVAIHGAVARRLGLSGRMS